MGKVSRRLMVALTTALMVTTSPAGHAIDNLPDLGDYAETILSRVEEERLGREFMRNARSQLRYIGDPALNRYLTSLGSRLAKNSDDPDADFRFYLVQNDSLNAFAVPGGHISVHTGLILATRHEGELASVLAHEIAHITQHHMARLVAQSRNQTLPAMAAIVAAILLGGAAGQAALIGTNAGLIENQLAYSRAFEREADSIGIRTLARTGYDPRAMPTFFEHLQNWSRVQESNVPEFLRTHPLTSNRIADSLSRAEQYAARADHDETDFYHARARIRALYSDTPAVAVRSFAANLQSGEYENEFAERYGYALALAASDQYQQAQQEISHLIDSQPKEQRYSIAEAEIAMSAGQFDRAVATFAEVYRKSPLDPVVSLHYANALVKTKRYAQAKQVIKRDLLQRPDEPNLYALLARAEGESGNQLAAHQTLAEYHYLRDNPREALRQLDLAKKYVGDSFYARSSVEARIDEIKQEISLSGESGTRPDPR